MIEHDDLLALQLLEAALAAGEIIDDAGRLAVRIEQQRKDVRKHAPVGRIGAAVIDGDQRRLVGGDAVDHRVGDADRQRIPGGDVGVALLPLVAFDAALDLVLGLAFVPGQLDAIDAAVADVDQVQIVDEAAEEAGAAGRIGTDAIALQRKVLLVGARVAGSEGAERRQRQRGS